MHQKAQKVVGHQGVYGKKFKKNDHLPLLFTHQAQGLKIKPIPMGSQKI